jgi:membrane protein implicated in regulation of membrane protease activity
MLWLSVIFLFLELFLPGMILFGSVASGFLCAACLSLLLSEPWLLFGAWLFGNIAAFFVIKGFLKRSKLCRAEDATDDTNIMGMIGQVCVVVRQLPNGQLLVVFGFEEWMATPLNQNEFFAAGEQARIVRIVGNRIIIKKDLQISFKI